MPGDIYIKGKSPTDIVDSNYFFGLINKWKPPTEVWPFVYGDDALAFVATITSAYSCYYFRRRLLLGHIARLSVYMPVVALSGIVTQTFQGFYMTPKIINAKTCPLCIQLNSVGVQLFSGWLVPISMASICSFYYADRALTYAVPPLAKAPKEVGQLWWKFVKPYSGFFVGLAVIQIIGAMAITYEKQKCFVKIQDKIFISRSKKLDTMH